MQRKRQKNKPNGFLRYWLIASGVLALVSAMIINTIPQKVSAAPGDLSSAGTKYPVIVGTILQQCALCHLSSIPDLNPYGAAYKAAGRNLAAFGLIENLDSDKDGVTNLVEITKLTFPGNALSFPPLPTATNTATATAVPPTATFTATAVPPTATSIPPTATKIPPTATSIPPTATSVPPTATAIPPTATSMPPTALPTDMPTAIPPTALPTDMPTTVPPTALPTDTVVAPTMTAVVPPGTGTFNLDILKFAVTEEIKLSRPKPIRIWLIVNNTGQLNGTAIATVVGVQNGIEFYRNSMNVFDQPGGWPSTFIFPNSSAMVEGKITWTVTLVDATNTDIRTATTKIEGRERRDDDHHEKKWDDHRDH